MFVVIFRAVAKNLDADYSKMAAELRAIAYTKKPSNWGASVGMNRIRWRLRRFNGAMTAVVSAVVSTVMPKMPTPREQKRQQGDKSPTCVRCSSHSGVPDTTEWAFIKVGKKFVK